MKKYRATFRGISENGESFTFTIGFRTDARDYWSVAEALMPHLKLEDVIRS